jgi:hypothetical protein
MGTPDRCKNCGHNTALTDLRKCEHCGRMMCAGCRRMLHGKPVCKKCQRHVPSLLLEATR